MPSMPDVTDLDPAATARVELASRWLRELARPHPDLGREGPVCPYLGRAWDLDAVEFFPVHARAGVDRLVAQAWRLRAELQRRNQDRGRDRVYHVLSLVPYGLPDSELRQLVQRVHEQLRPHFVQLGTLIGDFWPDHRGRGLHSDRFRPFASPLPMLPIRNMVPGDLPFFAAPWIPAPERLTYLGYYRRFFADRLPAYWQDQLAQAARAARDTLAPVGRSGD